MLLDLMKITHSNRGLYVTDRTRFYGRYQRLLKVSFRVVRYYLQTLKKYFRVTLTGGKYQIAYRAEQFEKTAESGKAQAREYTARFSGDTAAVLKAFGITGRTAGTAEQDFIRRWFKEYGFDKSLVVEACSRTITATGSASFPYADKILKGWSEQQVRTLKDVEALDRKRQQRKAEKEQAAGADRRAILYG